MNILAKNIIREIPTIARFKKARLPFGSLRYSEGGKDFTSITVTVGKIAQDKHVRQLEQLVAKLVKERETETGKKYEWKIRKPTGEHKGGAIQVIDTFQKPAGQVVFTYQSSKLATYRSSATYTVLLREKENKGGSS